jgi:hypothetical protein
MKAFKILLAICAFVSINLRAQEISTSVMVAKLKNVHQPHPDSIQQDLDSEQNTAAQRIKKISKSFNLDANDKVNIDNQYGAIVVKIWNKNEIKVDVEVNVYSNSDSDAQKLIDGVNVEGNKNGNEVVFKTQIASRSGNFGSVIKNGIVKSRRELKINYLIYMPANNALKLSQKYGNIDLDYHNGPTATKVQYGSFRARSLNNSNNYISVEYGKIDIGEVNAATIKHNYGTMITIGEANNLDINSSYVALNIGTVNKSIKIVQEYGSSIFIKQVLENLTIDSEYSKINLGTVKGNTVIKSEYGNVTANQLYNTRINTGYAIVNIGDLNGDANIKMSYNNLSIKNIASNCKSFVFEGDYVNVGIGFASNFGGNFVVENSYGNFSGADYANSKLVSNSNNNKEYRGKIGNNGSSFVSIKSAYGNVNFR